jgi:hypothetical protein
MVEPPTFITAGVGVAALIMTAPPVFTEMACPLIVTADPRGIVCDPITTMDDPCEMVWDPKRAGGIVFEELVMVGETPPVDEENPVMTADVMLLGEDDSVPRGDELLIGDDDAVIGPDETPVLPTDCETD